MKEPCPREEEGEGKAQGGGGGGTPREGEQPQAGRQWISGSAETRRVLITSEAPQGRMA